MSKEMKFFIYLIERFSAHKSLPTSEVFREWDELELTDVIYNMYELYHSEAIENAFEDIDILVKERKRA